MKNVFILMFSLIATGLFGQDDVIILLDGKEFTVEANKEFTYITLNGDSVKFTVMGGMAQPIAVREVVEVKKTSIAPAKGKYKDAFVSFSSPAELAMTKTNLWTGIDQLSFSSGLGSGLIIYQYAAFNPTTLGNHLLEDMLSEYDSRMVHTENSSIQIGKKKARGKKATIQTENGSEQVEVYAYPSGNGGLLISIYHPNSRNIDSNIEAFLSSVNLH